MAAATDDSSSIDGSSSSAAAHVAAAAACEADASHAHRSEGVAAAAAAASGGGSGASGGSEGGSWTFRLQIASDIHVEFLEPGDWGGDAVIRPAAPYLALLGDIGCPAYDGAKYAAFVRYQATRFDHVFLVAGNHEYYNAASPADSDGAAGKAVDMAGVRRTLTALARSLPDKLTFLDATSVVVSCDGIVHRGDGAAAGEHPASLVRLAGATLWSYVPEHARRAVVRAMNDYGQIMPPGGRDALAGEARLPARRTALAGAVLTALRAEHDRHVGWLHRMITDSTDRGEAATVVLTHHAPTLLGVLHPASCPPPGADPSAHGSGSPLEYLFSAFDCGGRRGGGGGERNTNVAVWAYGHTHYNVDEVRHGTRLVTNQRGYLAARVPGTLVVGDSPLEDTGTTPYRPDCVIEVVVPAG